METEYKVDRAGWGHGPWDGEPDRLEWRHEGMACLMVRNAMGAWCGYAGVPPEHPLHGVSYTEVFSDFCVHGGLTYSAACAGHICHTPAEGEPDHVWWLGFDCAHFGDMVPGMRAFFGMSGDGGYYRDVEYVRGEVSRLAEALRGPTTEG